jgi:hypothetical protein
MTRTIITRNDKSNVAHIGTSGFTVTALRDGEHLDVLMEFDQATREEGVAMVATVLTQLEEIYGESFVAAICAHYAKDTNKKFMDVGDHTIGIIRGGNRGKPPKGKR